MADIPHTSPEYLPLRARQMADFDARLPEFIDRFTWPKARIVALRQDSLRRLLAAARASSPWHAKRLAHIDPNSFTEADMERLPVMTKADLMDNFDSIITDRSIKLKPLEDYLSRLQSDGYLDGRLHAIASGGSSGKRGVFVYDWDSWIVMGLSSARVTALADVKSDGTEVVASIAADNASHGSVAFGQSFEPWIRRTFKDFVPMQVTLPFAHLIERLNKVQPTIVTGYPSICFQLCFAAADGRLHINPKAFMVGAEPLFPEQREALIRTFGARVYNFYGSSEAACVGFSCPAGPGLHLSDDTAISEPVDLNGKAVPDGERAEKIFLTNLFNTVLPLIRYELNDSITRLPDTTCACGSSFRKILDVHGRLDDAFMYEGGVFVHPVTFISPLNREPAIIEYQVQQREHGAHVLVRGARPFDTAALAKGIAAALDKVGLADAVVTIEPVDKIERTGAGKLRRFIRSSDMGRAV